MPNDANKNSNSAPFHNPVDAKTRTDVLKALSSSATPVKIFMDQKIFESKTSITTDTSKVFILCPKGSPGDAFKTSNILSCHFTFNNEAYFFSSQASSTDAVLIFPAPQVIYKIQRRDNFRVFVPKKMSQKIELGSNKNLKINLVDLSLGGCKILVSYSDISQVTNNFKPGSEVPLHMTFLEFESHLVYCKVKFVKDDPGTRTASIGLEFEKLKAEETQVLQSNIFKIDRLNRQSNID